MKNERGLTLVELLAVLALVGIISALIMGVFINGIKASNRTTTNQMLQQEANYITEKIRIEYLKHVDESDEEELNKVQISIVDEKLTLEGIVISEGYTYDLHFVDIFRSNSTSYLSFTIRKNEQFQTVNTTLSKLRLGGD